MSDRLPKVEIFFLLILSAVLIFVIPILNSAVPTDHPFYISNYLVNLLGQYFCLAIVAVSLDFLWGYTGLLSLGQMLFFSLGGYAFGMHLMLMIGRLGQYKSDLPDFMVFLGYNKLPDFWVPFYSFWF
ncbi:MAG: hypothetical protein NZL93_06015, partial [Chthoniobacterales bacterium]|nr:hypothetical protein [Chthoniobacterales bacterium]